MIAFYVSGHGYGQAARAGAVIEALLRLRPDVRIAVRTRAPRMMFPAGIEYQEVQVDSAVVESADSLTVDNERSIANLRDLLSQQAAIVEREVQFLRANQVRGIAADIPFLAGPIARQAAVPAIAMGNFTWDWIFENAASPELLARIRQAYGMFTEALRFPLSHAEGWDVFPSVTDVPLVTPRSSRPREEIRVELGLGEDRRPTVLIGGRARLTPDVRERIRRECNEFVFLTPDMHESFSDLIRAADIVVAKIGYSTAAECIAERKKLLYPPREGFREESVLIPESSHYLTARPISTDDWSQGRWKPYLVDLLNVPASAQQIRTDGADECARRLITVILP